MAKNFFKQILSREGNFATLDDIVYKAAFDKLTKDELKQLITDFATHPRIQEAIKADYNEEVLRYMKDAGLLTNL